MTMSWAPPFVHVLSWFLAGMGALLFLPDLQAMLPALSGRRIPWGRSIAVLRDLHEKLESGWLPTPLEWESLRTIANPWGDLACENIAELRENGIAVVPTLKRLEKVLIEQKNADHESRARSAQAWGQAVVCGAIVPLLAGALYFLVPGLSDAGWVWWAFSLLAFAMDGLAIVWMLQMSEQARWGGLKSERRSWVPGALCFAERLLGALRAGIPADLAWSRGISSLLRQAPALASAWGADLWSESAASVSGTAVEESSRILISQGEVFKKTIRASVFEGRSCSERIEAGIEALRAELSHQVQREIGLLSTRALKPLFILVAPSILFLMVTAFVLTWEKWGFV